MKKKSFYFEDYTEPGLIDNNNNSVPIIISNSFCCACGIILMFAYYKYSKKNIDNSKITNEDDRPFADRLTIDYGVASIPISVFFKDKRQDQVLRFCFAKENEELERAAEKLMKV